MAPGKEEPRPQECVIHKPRHARIQLSHSELQNCTWFICVHASRRDFCISPQKPGLKPIELGKKKTGILCEETHRWFSGKLNSPTSPASQFQVFFLSPKLNQDAEQRDPSPPSPVLHHRAPGKLWPGCSCEQEEHKLPELLFQEPSCSALSLQRRSSEQGKWTCKGATSISEQETPSHGKATPEEPGKDCLLHTSIKCMKEKKM